MSAPAAASKQHKFSTFTVTVAPDIAATPTAADYEITVENAEFLLSRLTAPYHGMLSNSFVADLNNDGGFEVVVTFTTGDGHDTGIKVFS